MGFFSSNCKVCGHPLLCIQATDRDGLNKWMSQAVAVHDDGSIYIGEYDGYGRIGDTEEDVTYMASCYHRHCWEMIGKPMEFDGESSYAPDQGWFFEDGDHSIPPPKSIEEVQKDLI